MLSKDQFDVSLVFLSYLTHVGNSTKVAISLGLQPEEVEVLAAKEDWAAKLKTFVGLRHCTALSARDRVVRRELTLLQAIRLRAIVLRAVEELNKVSPQELIVWMSPRDAKSGEPRFSAKALLDLARALDAATRVINRLLGQSENKSQDEALENRAEALNEAFHRAMCAIDELPGLDSVALAGDELAKWKSSTQESQDECHDS